MFLRPPKLPTPAKGEGTSMKSILDPKCDPHRGGNLMNVLTSSSFRIQASTSTLKGNSFHSSVKSAREVLQDLREETQRRKEGITEEANLQFGQAQAILSATVDGHATKRDTIRPPPSVDVMEIPADSIYVYKNRPRVQSQQNGLMRQDQDAQINVVKTRQLVEARLKFDSCYKSQPRENRRHKAGGAGGGINVNFCQDSSNTTDDSENSENLPPLPDQSKPKRSRKNGPAPPVARTSKQKKGQPSLPVAAKRPRCATAAKVTLPQLRRNIQSVLRARKVKYTVNLSDEESEPQESSQQNGNSLIREEPTGTLEQLEARLKTVNQNLKEMRRACSKTLKVGHGTVTELDGNGSGSESADTDEIMESSYSSSSSSSFSGFSSDFSSNSDLDIEFGLANLRLDDGDTTTVIVRQHEPDGVSIFHQDPRGCGRDGVVPLLASLPRGRRP